MPEKKCQDFPIFIPRKACKDFPKTVCVKDPVNTPRKIPKKVCASIPKEVCNKIPVQIIKHVPKTVTKKVCTSTKPSGKGYKYSDAASYYPPATYHDASDYHTSHSELKPIVAAASGKGLDDNINNYFDGVEDVPHFNYEKWVPFVKKIRKYILDLIDNVKHDTIHYTAFISFSFRVILKIIIVSSIDLIITRTDCKRPCFDQLKRQILESLLFWWCSKMCRFSWTKHGRLQSALELLFDRLEIIQKINSFLNKAKMSCFNQR